VLPPSGVPIARTTVQAISKDELSTDVVKKTSCKLVMVKLPLNSDPGAAMTPVPSLPI
jgi:hypothetical protein